MSKRELIREITAVTVTAIFLGCTMVYAQQKIDSKKAPIPSVPTWFSIEYFEQYIDRSPKEVRQVFKDTTTPFKYVTKEECINRGWRDMQGKDIDLFMKEDIVNGYVMDRAFIYAWYSVESNYTKCNAVKFRTPLWRLNDYIKELTKFGYKDQPNEFRQEGHKGFMKTFVYRKPKRVVRIFIAGGEQTIEISISKVDQ